MKLLNIPKILNIKNIDRLAKANCLLRKIRKCGEVQVVSVVVANVGTPKLFLNVFDKETMYNAGFVSNILQKDGIFKGEQDGIIVEWVLIAKQPQLTTQAMQDFVFHVEG